MVLHACSKKSIVHRISISQKWPTYYELGAIFKCSKIFATHSVGHQLYTKVKGLMTSILCNAIVAGANLKLQYRRNKYNERNSEL